MSKEKQLTIALLTEKLQKLTNKKVILEKSSSKETKAAKEAIQALGTLRWKLFDITKDDDLFQSFDSVMEKLQKLASNKEL